MSVRVVGAGAALAITGIVMATGLGFVLAGASWGAALVAIGVVGLIVGPVTGWRHGWDAVNRTPGWAGHAVVTLLVTGVGVALAWAVVSVLGGATTGSLAADPLVFVSAFAYSALLGSVAAVVSTFVVAVPLGFLWARATRSLVARTGP